MKLQDFPGGPVAWISHSQHRGHRFSSLFMEVRSHMLSGAAKKKRVANSKVLHLCREDPGALANVREKAVQKGKSPQCPKAVNVLVLTKEKRLDSGNCR